MDEWTASTLYECGTCGGMTKREDITEHLPGGIDYTYTVCDECKVKKFVWVSNSRIRGLMTLQKKTAPGKRKVKLWHKIEAAMNKLKEECKL